MLDPTGTQDADRHYIIAADGQLPRRTSVLKQDECFGVFNEIGDIDAGADAKEGLYCAGTRFLSQLNLSFAGHRPLLLGSYVRRDNLVLTVDLSNPDLYLGERLVLPRGTVHINRSKWLWQRVCYERTRIHNFSLSPLIIDLEMEFQADYADIFEVRGERRARRGIALPAQTDSSATVLAYLGLDDAERRTRLQCTPPPQEISSGRMRFRFALESHAEKTIVMEIAYSERAAGQSRQLPAVLPYKEAFALAKRSRRRKEVLGCRIRTSNEQFNALLQTSGADLGMLMTDTGDGLYPYAGVPWFDAPFGRDGIITALETLWLWPQVARGVLAFLAGAQAQSVDETRDAEPGKILHEARSGEMAALGEIPFGRYYGSVDATPLFVMLAGAYFRSTRDLAFIEAIWPQLQLALAWIDSYGDLDNDGFVEYSRRSPDGLVQQGWKDSQDSVFHADGRLAEPPIALCEVQGYVYAARSGAATIAAALGMGSLAARLKEEAVDLRTRFNDRFWCEDIGSYALALDGDKQPCRVLTSNPGHCLYTGIATQERARKLLKQFSGRSFFSGWGVRTVAEGQPRYNPMGYHNGSIWPHDTAILGAGAARYHCKSVTARLLDAQFDASTYFEQYRLPELFCGFRRRPGEAPTAYPVACSPQAWAAGAVFMLLGACLGVKVDASMHRLVFRRPMLPRCLDEVSIEGLAVGEASVDLRVHRYPAAVGIDVQRRSGKVDVLVES